MIGISRKSLRPVAIALVLGLAGGGTAAADDERVEHYRGAPARTLQEAVSNFSAYNARLSAVLEQETLETQDLEQVHELTYTLENALAKMREELETLAVTLEELHLASEGHDVEATRRHGAGYLDTATTVVP